MSFLSRRTKAFPALALSSFGLITLASCSDDDDPAPALANEGFLSAIDSAQSTPTPVAGVDVRVTIRSLAPEGGTLLTPIWVGFHDGQFDLYDSGSPADLFFPDSDALERIAEDGNLAPLNEAFVDQGFGSRQGTLLGLIGSAAGPVDPGESVSATFRLDPTNSESRYFSYASMVLPSNDAFVANGDPMAHEIFDAGGTFTGAGFTVLGSAVLDAGTEVNDELPANTAFFGQATPDTGMDEGGNVGPHPGFLDSGGILDDPNFTNGDFTAAGYGIFEVTFEAVAAPAAATGLASYTLNPNTRELDFEINVAGLSGPATLLHLHSGPAGSTGPVEVDLFDSVTVNAGGVLRAAGQATLTADQVVLLRADELYLNLHTDLNPSGEVRGQVEVGSGFRALLDAAQEIPAPITGRDVRVTLRNRAPASGTFQTPVWVGFHDGQFDVYDSGSAAITFFTATNGLERLAEDGTLSNIQEGFEMQAFGEVQGAVFGAAGPLAPGELAAATFRLDPGALDSAYFSYASMVIPSNDAFIANGSPVAHPVFDGAGDFVAADFSVGGDEVLDAGTEVNDEAPANTAFFGQAAPDTGDVEGGVVGAHPGFLPVGSGGILASDMFAGADFTAVDYECLSVSLTDEGAPALGTGQATFRLNGAEDTLSFDVSVRGLSGPATMMHLHNAAAGATGPVELDLFDAVVLNADGVLTATGSAAVTADQVAAMRAGELYLNVHTRLNAAGELRGQVELAE